MCEGGVCLTAIDGYDSENTSESEMKPSQEAERQEDRNPSRRPRDPG